MTGTVPPFARFLAQFRAEGAVGGQPERIREVTGITSPDAVHFLSRYAGATFGGGMYRLLQLDVIPRWNQVVGDAFPDFADRIRCFGMDWLGRAFALDGARSRRGEPLILLLEPGTGEALELPATFVSFHDEELAGYPDAVVAAGFFHEWSSVGGAAPGKHECVGYRVPLFLGGEDTIQNLEVIDAEVYWVISGQLRNKTRSLPPGTTIRSISIL